VWVIVRQDGGRLVLVRQTDHALLSGWLAAAWGRPPWTPPRPFDESVVAARLHDLPWARFDETLPLRPDGRPLAFHEVARAVSTELYGRGLDAVEAIDPHAGLLSSLHFSGFFTSHWGWLHGHRPPSPEGGEGDAIGRFVARELARQRRLRERLGIDGDDDADRTLMCAYVWLQLWDRISLDICRYGFGGWSADYPPAPLGPAPGAEVVRLHVELEPGGVCRLDPYPLLPLPFRARVPAVLVPLATAAGEEELRRAWRAGGADTIDVTFLGRR
jgi:Protein of unknown function (DUF3891)